MRTTASLPIIDSVPGVTRPSSAAAQPRPATSSLAGLSSLRYRIGGAR